MHQDIERQYLYSEPGESEEQSTMDTRNVQLAASFRQAEFHRMRSQDDSDKKEKPAILFSNRKALFTYTNKAQIFLGVVLIILSLLGVIGGLLVRQQCISRNIYHSRFLIQNEYARCSNDLLKLTKCRTNILHCTEDVPGLDVSIGDLYNTHSEQKTGYEGIQKVEAFMHLLCKNVSATENRDWPAFCDRKYSLLHDYIALPAWLALLVILTGVCGLKLTQEPNKATCLPKTTFTVVNTFNIVITGPAILFVKFYQFVSLMNQHDQYMTYHMDSHNDLVIDHGEKIRSLRFAVSMTTCVVIVLIILLSAIALYCQRLERKQRLEAKIEETDNETQVSETDNI